MAYPQTPPFPWQAPRPRPALLLLLLLIVVSLQGAPLADGQLLHGTVPLPSFDVATIKPCAPDGTPAGFNISMQRGFRARCMPLLQIIRFAYSVRTDAQLAGEHGTTEHSRYDVDAKFDETQAKAFQSLPPEQQLDRMKLMVQSLLATRFGLRVSYNTRQLPEFGLVLAKDGPRFTPAAPPRDHINPPSTLPGTRPAPLPTMDVSAGYLKAGNASMQWFSAWLSNLPEVDSRTVVNETGLTGTYDFTLHWRPEQDAPDSAAPASTPEATGSDTSAPAFMTALQEQLGLKLRSQKGPVEVLLIDHIEPPTPN